jgi:hypothetical protein
MRQRVTSPVVLCLVALATACGPTDTQPAGDPSTVSFTYSGDRNGTFSVSGVRPDVRTGTLYTTPWASGNNLLFDRTYTAINASLPSGTANHIMGFLVPAGETGTFTLSPEHFDELIFGYQSGVSSGQVYVFKPGTVTVTSATAGRVAGTFSGTAIDSSGSKTLTVTNGKFDVQIF